MVESHTTLTTKINSHEGHELMHLEMFIILMLATMTLQFILNLWSKKYYNSYFKVTLLLIWIVPFIISIHSKFYRMVFLWCLYNIGALIIFYKVKRTPLDITTPSINDQMAIILMNLSILMAFYGLYFGLLTRDIAHLLTDIITIKLGMISYSLIPKNTIANNICALCGLILINQQEQPEIFSNCAVGIDFSHFTHPEKCLTLDCAHRFHEFCLRGWILIGKKDTCPCCKEKYQLRHIFNNPWELANLYYGDFLHILRFLLSWYPLLSFILSNFNSLVGLK